jgi:hypothetical protein
MHWNGISVGAQAASASPLQAGLIGQANFGFVYNRLNFAPSTVFSKLLRGTSRELATIIDCGERRSWLVPKLSLLLHMAHVYVQDGIYEDSESDGVDPIPYVKPHHDGKAVEEELKQCGDIVVCGQGQDALTLRTLLLGLNINLLKSIQVNEENNGKSVFGFELMDVVTEPGKGGFMKKIPIKPEGRNWLGITNEVDAVVVCSGLGRVMTPADGRKCDRCISLPKGSDYLAAPISCLSLLVWRHGAELKDPLEIKGIPISDRLSWTISGEPFRRCTHENTSETTCWERNPFQNLRRKNSLNLNLKKRGVVLSAQKLSLAGAVVFGKGTG